MHHFVHAILHKDMKPHSLDLPFGKNHTLQRIPKIVLAIISFMFLFVAPLKPLLNYPLSLVTNITLPPPESLLPPLSYSGHLEEDSTREITIIDKKCDIFTGEWVPNSEAPYYTNTTCWAIHDHQNCMKYGRPDSDFMKWRWKPNDCELPIFDPAKFLELVSGKSLAFVGDSVGRNQMQSLICLLSRVEYPVDISYTADDKSRRWQYSNNFTIANFWTPYLVKAREADPNGPTFTGLYNLYLDEFDLDWTTQIEEFDYVVISAGHWFFRPTMFHEEGHLMGCHYCLDKNVTDLSMYYSYRKAFRTAFKAINSLENFKGVTFLRTFAPSHFENGLWNEGGDCVRKRPFRCNETSIEGINLKLYLTQMEEFRLAEREGEKKGLRFRLLDTTQAMLLRPDGHPSRYGHWPNENVTLYNDCVHWCLPGPIDTWNDFLLEMLRIEGDSVQGKIHSSDRIMKIE